VIKWGFVREFPGKPMEIIFAPRGGKKELE